MVVHIKNPETVSLIRELAQLRGQGITEVLTDVMRQELEREDRKSRSEDLPGRSQK
jgi:hypothetical protein